MAVLCLIASFAYLLREQGMASMSGMAPLTGLGRVGPATTQAVESGGQVPALHTGADHPQPSEDMARMPDMPAGPVPADAPELSSQAPNAPPDDAPRHDHAAHCPFCFTAAFALEAGGLSLGPVVAALEAVEPPAAAQVYAVAVRHFGARAPPAPSVG